MLFMYISGVDLIDSSFVREMFNYFCLGISTADDDVGSSTPSIQSKMICVEIRQFFIFEFPASLNIPPF